MSGGPVVEWLDMVVVVGGGVGCDQLLRCCRSPCIESNKTARDSGSDARAAAGRMVRAQAF